MLQRIMMFLSIPYAIIVAYREMLAYHEKSNAIYDRKSRLTGEKRIAYSDKIDCSVVKDKLKKHKMSLNDLILAVSALTFSTFITDRK